jgi:antitoxin component HigA of HigAB toxin-antitoxin module
MQHYDKRSADATPSTIFAVERCLNEAHHAAMLGADELLKILEQRGVTRAEISRVLNLPSSRVSEMYTGKRRLQLDEAKTLVEKFGIEEGVNPLSVPIARLLILYGADSLGVPLSPEDPRVEELARDFRAFSMFAADPRVRESTEAVEGFFRGLRLGQDRTA